MPAAPQAPRWFVDENSLGVAKALAYVRGDITWPGAPCGPVPAGAADTAWLPIVGQAGLVVLTRDKRIRSRPLERQALLNHGVRACFLTSGGSLDLFSSIAAKRSADTGRHSKPGSWFQLPCIFRPHASQTNIPRIA